MGQTLSHGVYLPNEGERNCYAGLASNWQILNTAVGAIAEKAPLVHTHTVSQITDFPAYGNTAGTICEGNDSRLSDARTPVAHTHGKADITDLFNSANVWTGTQTILGSYLENEASGNARTCLCLMANRDTAAQSGIYVTKFRQNRAQGAMNPPDLQFISFDVLENATRTNGALVLNVTGWNGNVPDSAILYSTYANPQLGTSTNPWKTLNGINPGALSLPNSPGGTGTENVNYYDLSGNITARDGSAANGFTAPCDGWIAIGTFATWLQISNDTLILATTANPGADGFAQAFLPVRKGNAIRIVVNQTNTQFQSFKLLPCEGNV